VPKAEPMLVGENAMKLSFGQWHFLFQEHVYHRASALSDSTSSQSLPMSADRPPMTWEEDDVSTHSSTGAVSESKEEEPQFVRKRCPTPKLSVDSGSSQRPSLASASLDEQV